MMSGMKLEINEKKISEKNAITEYSNDFHQREGTTATGSIRLVT